MCRSMSGHCPAAKAVTEFFAGDGVAGDVLLNDPYPRRQPLARPDRLCAGFRRRPAAFLVRSTALTRATSARATHGAYNAAATDIWQEGIRITPLRLYDRGEVRRDLLEMIATNVRHPRDFRGDLAAMIGSSHLGERRLLALAGEFGWAVADDAIEAVLDGAERQTRAVIAGWRDGVYHGEALLDDDGRGHDDIHIRATVEQRSAAATALIDLSDSHAEVASFVNSSYPNMRSAVVVALSYLIDPDTPKNDGTFRPITVVAKPGTVVWANPGMPVTLATNHCGQEILEAIVKALAPACPDRAMAGWGRRFRIAIQGKDPRGAAQESNAPGGNMPGGKPFIWHFFQARPGGGASPAGDGWPGAGEWQAAGGIKFGSLEVTEVCASRYSSAAMNSAPIPGVPANTAADPAGSSRWSSKPPSRRSATPPATACATAPAASSAAAMACRTATHTIPTGPRRARSKPRKPASRSAPATS